MARRRRRGLRRKTARKLKKKGAHLLVRKLRIRKRRKKGLHRLVKRRIR